MKRLSIVMAAATVFGTCALSISPVRAAVVDCGKDAAQRAWTLKVKAWKKWNESHKQLAIRLGYYKDMSKTTSRLKKAHFGNLGRFKMACDELLSTLDSGPGGELASDHISLSLAPDTLPISPSDLDSFVEPYPLPAYSISPMYVGNSDGSSTGGTGGYPGGWFGGGGGWYGGGGYPGKPGGPGTPVIPIAPTPEPSTLVMIGTGMAVLLKRRVS